MELVDIRSQANQVLSKLNLKLTAEDIETGVDKLIEDMNNEIDELEKSEDKSFKATCYQLEKIIEDYEPTRASYYLQSQLGIVKTTRDAASEAIKKVQKLFIDIFMRPNLYQLLRDCKQLDEELDRADRKLLDNFLRDFRRNGLDLSPEVQSEFKEINHEISRLGIDGRKTLNDVIDYVLFTKEELEGVPESVIEKFEKEGDKYKVSTQYPECFPVLEYAKSGKTRRRLETVYSNRTVKEGNTERLEDLISLRARAAHLLGYDTHADYQLEIKTAKTKETVLEFLDDLETKLKPYGKKEIEQILKYKQEEEPNSDFTQANIEDYRYYLRLVTERENDLDNELIKEYFPVKETVDTMLKFYQKVFGLTFIEIDDAPKWHDEVICYGVIDEEDVFRGAFYLDLFPREGKFGHAAAANLLSGKKDEHGYDHTLAVMMCNFDKPTEKNPSLLKHSEVETLYHEFGHIVHEVMTSAKYGSLTIDGVAWDFVEAPSQIFENWTWEPKILREITKHYKTGERMPDELIEKLVNSRYSMAALFNLRQIMIGKYDMTIHTMDEADTKRLWHEMREKITLFKEIPDINPAASIGHYFGGYDAGYYGYLWSLVMAQDMYTKFQEIGIDSPEVGIKYRKIVLEEGGQRDAMELVEEFLGRKVNNEAFLKNLGL